MISLLVRYLLLLAALASAGCSLAFVRPAPPDAHLRDSVEVLDCTDSQVAPVADGVAAGLMLLGGALSMTSEYDPQDGVMTLLLGGGLAAVAARGWNQVAHCQRALFAQRLRAEQAAARMPPPAYTWAGAYPPWPSPVAAAPAAATASEPAAEPEAELADGAAAPPSRLGPPPGEPPAPVPMTWSAPPAWPPRYPTAPAKPEPPDQRLYLAMLAGNLDLRETHGFGDASAVLLSVRLGLIQKSAVAVELIGEWGGHDTTAPVWNAIGLGGFYPLWAGEGGPHARPAIGGALAVKLAATAWDRPRVSGLSVQPSLSVRLRTRVRFNPRLDLGWELTTFEQRPRHVLVPRREGTLAHGPSVLLGLEF